MHEHHFHQNPSSQSYPDLRTACLNEENNFNNQNPYMNHNNNNQDIQSNYFLFLRY